MFEMWMVLLNSNRQLKDNCVLQPIIISDLTSSHIWNCKDRNYALNFRKGIKPLAGINPFILGTTSAIYQKLILNK